MITAKDAEKLTRESYSKILDGIGEHIRNRAMRGERSITHTFRKGEMTQEILKLIMDDIKDHGYGISCSNDELNSFTLSIFW